MGLVELYGVTASIAYGEEDEFAANLLLDFLKPHLRSIKTVLVTDDKPRKDDLVIYVGSFESNRAGGKAFKSIGFMLNWAVLTDGSFLLKTYRRSGKTVVFVSGKDRLGTLYAAYDLRNYYLHVDMGRVLLNELNVVERAQLKYRWFRNWDYRTHWDNSGAATGTSLEPAQSNRTSPYLENGETYLRDLKKTVDFMSEHRLNGLILWGFLRDSHGGVTTARELCNYARERGVRILAGIGLSGHGGFFYEGEHPYNLNTWLRSHPELQSVDEKGQFRTQTLCPEKAANRKWYQDGLKWLYENTGIGGISLELGDFFVCYCEDCKKARQTMGGSDPNYYKDTARIANFLSAEATRLDPKTWVSYLTYTGFDLDSIQSPSGAAAPPRKVTASYPPDFVKQVPDFAICQWDLAPMLKNQVWPSPFRAPAKHNVGLLNWGNIATSFEREVYWKRLEEVTHHAIASNLEGLGIYGELSPDAANVELTYLLFSEFAFNPALDLEEFSRVKLSRLYGGEEAARKLVKILDLLESEAGLAAENIDQAVTLARQSAEAANAEGKDRWSRLVRYLEKLKHSSS